MSEFTGRVYWNELMTRDIDSAKKFYSKTCGWTYDSMPTPDGEYHLAMAGKWPAGGMMDMSSMEGLEQVPPHWFTYLAVDDIDETVAKCRDLGASITREPFEVANVGKIAIVCDPTGASLGFIQPAPPGSASCPDDCEDANGD